MRQEKRPQSDMARTDTNVDTLNIHIYQSHITILIYHKSCRVQGTAGIALLMVSRIKLQHVRVLVSHKHRFLPLLSLCCSAFVCASVCAHAGDFGDDFVHECRNFNVRSCLMRKPTFAVVFSSLVAACSEINLQLVM